MTFKVYVLVRGSGGPPLPFPYEAVEAIDRESLRERAATDIVVFLDERYCPGTWWLPAILSAMEIGAKAVGGPVLPPTNNDADLLLYYLSEYAYGHRFAEGNMAYRQGSSTSDATFLRAMEVTLCGAPSLDRYREERYRDSRRIALHSCAGHGAFYRGLYAISRLALPPLLAWRTWRGVAERRELRREWLRRLPALCRLWLLQMAGEISGSVTVRQ